MSDSTMSRRKFVQLGTLGAAGASGGLAAALAWMRSAEAQMGGRMGGGMNGGSTGTTVIDPPPGSAFADPATAVPNALGIVELVARRTAVTLAGATANLLTYNGSYPGPTIRARAGSVLRIRLTSGLTDTSLNILGHARNLTNLHTHGLHVSPKPPADSMMVVLGTGEGFDYVYDLAHETPGHLNLYHPHVHGNAAEQYWAGLMGALVVEDEPGTPLSGYETHVMVLKDLSVSGGHPTPHSMMSDYMHGKEGNLVLVNGKVNPVLATRPGQVQRWRIVNGCNARFFKLSLEGHTLQVVGTDGGLLDRPWPVSSLLLSPGERVDLLVKASTTKKSYRFLSLPYGRGGMSSLEQRTLLTLSCGGQTASDALPTSVNPSASRLNVDATGLTRRTIALSMMRGRGYINGVSFAGMDNAFTIRSESLGCAMDPVYEVWEVTNQSGMDHPFHQHVNAGQVLGIRGGDADYARLYSSAPAWKDTVIVPGRGSVTLLVPVLDWSGMTMFHCHIMEHEDIGMMGVWDIADDMPMPM